MKLQERIQALIRHLSEGMHEREEIVAVSFLGALSGQNTFLYGPPGTAKSLISRRIACGFEKPTYFECLMNRFSAPEDVFGPVSLKELKEDRYVRKTEGYLPKAEFAFLDEIWKSSPAILNALLTLINERRFRNGETVEQAPLKALIAASNETPDANQGLDALYDRFIVRLMVPPISRSEHFDNLLNSGPTEADVTVPPHLIVKREEWQEWRRCIQESVQLSKETLTIIHLIRMDLQDQHDTLKVYVSDRRWQRAAMLMKAAAFFNDRKETNHSDALLLQHCLWTTNENREAVAEIVAKAVRETGFEGEVDLAALDQKKDALEKTIQVQLYHSEDVYKSTTFDGKEYFVLDVQNRYGSERKILIPVDRMMTSESFQPLDDGGNPQNDLSCRFDGQGVCEIRRYDRTYHDKTIHFKPDVLFNKGDKRQGVPPLFINALRQEVVAIGARLTAALDASETLAAEYHQTMASPFVPQNKGALAYEGVMNQINSIRMRILDCDRLNDLCR